MPLHFHGIFSWGVGGGGGKKERKKKSFIVCTESEIRETKIFPILGRVRSMNLHFHAVNFMHASSYF